MKNVGIGVIGCGMISEIYMKNITERYANIDITACADLAMDRAVMRAEQFHCRALSIDELLNDPEVEIVLNLTVPAVHASVSMQALKAGKHVYTEKPLYTDSSEGRELMAYAKSHGLMIGNAPDTFLGAGLQTVRKLLDDNAIGTPFAAQAFMFSKGPESFHPNPKFFYEEGAGPVLDWGPYYISALVTLFGPIEKIVSTGKSPKPVRVPLSDKCPYKGEPFEVKVPTYVTSLLEFRNGFSANLTVSFDMHYPYWEADMPYIRIFGTEGSIDVPDVNMFKGPVILRKNGTREVIPLVSELTENCRGIGLADMARALREGGTYRANGELGNHVADVLITIQNSVNEDRYYQIESTCTRPDPLTESDLKAILK